MIEIKNLTKIYNSNKGKVIALNNINLKIEDGDIFGVIGLSGAGKSTLVRCINGLETFNEGDILYNGETVKFTAEYRRKVAMIFQQFNLLQQRTVLKNVELAGEIVGDTKRKEKAIKLLNAVGIGDKLNAYPSQLSGGQQQRVAIARALMSDPEVLLCDEATSALDPETTQSILELIKQLNKQLNITVVVISHQMSVIEQICNKVAIIDHSEIVESGYINEVFLSPKTAIGKKLVYSSHIFSTDKNEMLIKIKFDGGVNLPVVTNIIKELNVRISILYAETKELCGKVYGQTIFTLPDYKKDIGKVREYLTSNGIAFEELSSNELCQCGQKDSAQQQDDCVKEVH